MRYSLHETDKHRVVATTVAADRDEALEWFSEKLRLMLTFEGDPLAAEYLLDEWSESLPYMAHTPKPTIPVFVVRAVAARPQASQGAESGTSIKGWAGCLADLPRTRALNAARAELLETWRRPQRSLLGTLFQLITNRLDASPHSPYSLITWVERTCTEEALA
jgi:hypothetical protein